MYGTDGMLNFRIQSEAANHSMNHFERGVAHRMCRTSDVMLDKTSTGKRNTSYCQLDVEEVCAM